MNHGGRHGFTLLELSIVLVLIAIIIGGGLAVFVASVQTTAFNNTVSRMDAIEANLLNYAVYNRRIPCPSDLLKIPGNQYYGVEAANPGSCTGGTPAATFTSTAGVAEGGVPTNALRLSDDYMYDGWGRRFRYAVDPVYTVANSLPVKSQLTYPVTGDATSITVNDATGAARTSAGIYALISHGANGHGAYTSSAGIVVWGSTNTGEQTNCHCNSSGVAGTYTATYVQQNLTQSSASAYNSFDDIVAFKDAWQMQTPGFPVTSFDSGHIIWATDSANNRIQAFDPNGNFIYQLPCASGACSSGATTSLFNSPQGISIDRTGNIWVGDTGNHRILAWKLDGSSNFAITAQGNGNGLFLGVAVDKGNHIWGSNANQIQEFDSSGNWLGTLCNNYFGTSPPACAAGAGTGYFTSAVGIAFDLNNNLWVVDSSNNTLSEFTSGTFAFAQSIGGFSSPSYVAVDSGNNIWVTDTGNKAIKEYSANGVLVATYSYSGYTYISAAEKGIALDPRSDFWIGDVTNSHLTEANILGTLMTTSGSAGTASGQFSSSSVINLAIGPMYSR